MTIEEIERKIEDEDFKYSYTLSCSMDGGKLMLYAFKDVIVVGNWFYRTFYVKVALDNDGNVIYEDEEV